MSKKFFVIADVHSFYTEMKNALDVAGFEINNPDHILISCGDVLDRGPQSSEVLEFLLSIPKDRRIFIRGNHEDLLEDCISRRDFYPNDISNGTLKTIFNLCGLQDDAFWFGIPGDPNGDYHQIFDRVANVKPLWDYLAECVDFYELGTYIFVHSWVPIGVTDLQQATKEEWRSARWGNPFKLWNRGYRIPDKTVVVGHWHTSWAHSFLHNKGTEFGDDSCFDIFIDDGIIGLDACTVHSHKCNCFVIEE